MQFLKTLLWVAVAVLLAIFAFGNWHDVTLNLWGDLQADIKVPVLLVLAFLLGFLPTYVVQRGRIWSLKRRLDYHERQSAAPAPAAADSAEPEQS